MHAYGESKLPYPYLVVDLRLPVQLTYSNVEGHGATRASLAVEENGLTLSF